MEADKLWEGKKRAARYLRLYLPKPRMKVDLFLCDPATWGAIYTIRTGSREYVQRLVTHWTALTGGGHVKEGRLVFPACPWAITPAVSTPEEEDVFRAMRVPWTEPALRADTIHVEPLPCGHRVFDDRCDDCCAWAETAWRRVLVRPAASCLTALPRSAMIPAMDTTTRLPADVRAYALKKMHWSEDLFRAVEARFYFTHTMRWSEATWREIRKALAEVRAEL